MGAYSLEIVYIQNKLNMLVVLCSIHNGFVYDTEHIREHFFIPSWEA